MNAALECLHQLDMFVNTLVVCLVDKLPETVESFIGKFAVWGLSTTRLGPGCALQTTTTAAGVLNQDWCVACCVVCMLFCIH